MKKVQVLNYMVTIHPAEEGGFWAEVPALPGCFTQGETIEEITAMAREAIECHVAGLMKDGQAVPLEKRSAKKQQEVFSIPLAVTIRQFA